MDSLSIAHRAEDTNCERLTVGSRWHCVLGVVAVRVRFLRWRLGFRQFSFRPIVRALQGNTFNAFQRSPLLRQAVFPSGFRFQVGRMAQKSSSELLVTASRIQHRVPRRTLAPHTAQAFTNAPRGTRPPLRRPSRYAPGADGPRARPSSLRGSASRAHAREPHQQAFLLPTYLLVSLSRLAEVLS